MNPNRAWQAAKPIQVKLMVKSARKIHCSGVRPIDDITPYISIAP